MIVFNIMSHEEALEFCNTLAHTEARALLELYGRQIVQRMAIVGLMDLSRPVIDSSGNIIQGDEDFSELEHQYWRLQDEIELTQRYLHMCMKVR